jgi:AraC family transcriptional regulator
MEARAELRSPSALVQLVHYDFATPPDSMLRVDGKFRIELCLTSRHRSSRACFRDHWSENRFERIGPLFLVPPSHDMLVRSDEKHSRCPGFTTHRSSYRARHPSAAQ